jgi:hypothetical protein
LFLSKAQGDVKSLFLSEQSKKCFFPSVPFLCLAFEMEQETGCFPLYQSSLCFSIGDQSEGSELKTAEEEEEFELGGKTHSSKAFLTGPIKIGVFLCRSVCRQAHKYSGKKENAAGLIRRSLDSCSPRSKDAHKNWGSSVPAMNGRKIGEEEGKEDEKLPANRSMAQKRRRAQPV